MSQETDIKGFAAEKQTKLNELLQLAIPICNKMLAYGTMSGNQALEFKIDMSKRDWLNFNDTQVLSKASLLHIEATNAISDLALYNVTQLMLDNLIAAKNNYEAVLNDPRNAIVRRKTTTSKISALFQQANDILNNKMDRLVLVIAETQPDFCSDYFNARILVDLGQHNVSVEGKILDAATLVPIHGAKVEIIEAGKQIITSKSGKYQFKSLHGGNYTMRINMDHYKQQILMNIPIIEGNTYHSNIILERGDSHYSILPNTNIIPWYGSPDSNLLITVRNTSPVECNFMTYFTQNPGDPVPANKITLQPLQQHQFRVADYLPAETIYLHLFNTDILNTAQYLILFENQTI